MYKYSIEIIETRIETIEFRTRDSSGCPEFIHDNVEVRFILNGIFDSTCEMKWKPEYKDQDVLKKVILDKIYNV